MAVSRDSVARWYLPASAAECTELLGGTGIPSPAHLYLFDEASLPVLDKIGARNLTLGAGDTAPALQAFLPGWAATRAKLTSGAPTRLLNTTFPNVNANSYTVVLLARPASQGTDRTLVRLGDVFDDDAVIEINGSSVLRVGEGDGTRSTGTDNVIEAAHYFTLRVDDAANTVDAFFNATKVAGGAQSCNGTELCFGGNNVQTYLAAGAWLLWCGVWTSALSDADVATVVSRMKDGVPVVTEPSDYPDVVITSFPTVATPETSAAFAFTVATGSAEYSLDGGAYAPATSPIQLAGLAPGAHTIAIRSVDDPSAAQSFTWTVTAPIPNIANATTANAIRDRAVEVVKSLVPEYVSGSRFVAHRSEADGDFVTWCEMSPASAFRRFQIRFDGVNVPPAVSNTDHEEREVNLIVAVAYPHDNRAGKKQALDRDTAIDRDRDQLDWAIGMYGRPQFLAPHPDAVCVDSEAQRAEGEACDFLIINSRYRFRRALRGSL